LHIQNFSYSHACHLALAAQVKDLQAGNETLMREMKRILGETTPETVGLSRE
jgi:hypothetical protein